MARPATKELGVLGILREALAIPLRNPGLVASILLLLLPCNLLLTVPKFSPRLPVNVDPLAIVANRLRLPQEPSHGESPGVAEPGGLPAEVPGFENLHKDGVAPLDYVVGRLSTLAMVYLSAVGCKGKRSTLGALLSKVRRSWKKVAISFLYVQLFDLARICFFLMLAALMVIFEMPSRALFLVVLAVFSMLFSGIVFSLYLDIACELSLVISAVEEDKCGMAALAEAISVTRGRKLQWVVLTALLIALDWFKPTDYAEMGGQKQAEIASSVVVWRFASVLVVLLARLFGWLLWTVYYYECKKSHGLMGKEARVDEGQSFLIPISSSVSMAVSSE